MARTRRAGLARGIPIMNTYRAMPARPSLPLLLSLCSLGAAASAGCAGALGKLFGPTASPAELRRNTVSVSVESPEKFTKVYQGITARLRQRGKAELAKAFELQTGSAFGSGFLVRRNGRYLVVTNRHVVDFEDTAEVTIEGYAQPFLVTVVYADPIHDLAILAFGETQPSNLNGLPLASGKAHDLDSVVATGFPGLDGRPSYQATRGQISNEAFMVESRGQRLSYIQHTAAIDPGSSGGPLTSERGHVVGVNTLKVDGRDNMYLAVPVETLESVLSRADDVIGGKKTNRWLVAQLGASCGRFVAALKRDPEFSASMYHLITNEAVADRGLESLDSVLKTDKEFTEFFCENPTVALRFAVAIRLWKEAHGNYGLPVTCIAPAFDPDPESIRLQVKFERGVRDTYWRLEQGFWKLAGFDKIVSTKSPAKAPPKPKN